MSQLPDVQLEGLYGDLILQHYRDPHHRPPLAAPDMVVHELNPFCGDRVHLEIKMGSQNRVLETRADSEGCSIIQASASMLSDLLKGKTLEEIAGLAITFRSMMEGKEIEVESKVQLGELDALQVVRRYPVRIKCALLPWTALEEGLKEFHGRTG